MRTYEEMDDLLARIARGELLTHTELMDLVHAYLELRADKIMVDRWALEMWEELNALLPIAREGE